MAIPLPGSFGKAFDEGLESGSSLMDKLIRQRQAQQFHSEEMEYKNRYGGLQNLSGVAREVASLNMLKGLAGENSDIYQQAKAAFDLDQQRVRTNNELNQFYLNTPSRLYPTALKGVHAENMALKGLDPFGQPLENPNRTNQRLGKQEYLENPAFLQQQAVAGRQIDETIKLINPDAAFSYSGPQGQVKLLKDKYNAANGQISPEYEAYEEQLVHMHSLANQLRVYWKDSISPKSKEDLEYLSNPNSWINHPQIAKKKFEALVKTYENEKKATEEAINVGNPLSTSEVFEPTLMGQPANNNVIGEMPENAAATAGEMGLNLGSQSVTEKNIHDMAKEKKWSKKQLDWTLKKFGHKK